MMRPLTTLLAALTLLTAYPADKAAPADTVPHPAPEMVIVRGDTVSMVLPERKFGRFDRGLDNWLFIPKGQWAFGLTAAYGELNTEDIQLLSILKDVDLGGKTYSLSPYLQYFVKNNQSVGVKFNYTRNEFDLGSLAMDFSDDLNFSISDVSYYSSSYGLEFFYRNYIGLGSMKRFGIFNEVGLDVESGSSRFKRLYDGAPRDTRTVTTKASLNFSPGVTVFLMDYVSINVSFGVFGVHYTHEKQTTNGLDDGERNSSGANFRFNIFNIKFGLGIHI